jgi:hypothetical protein
LETLAKMTYNKASTKTIFQTPYLHIFPTSLILRSSKTLTNTFTSLN